MFRITVGITIVLSAIIAVAAEAADLPTHRWEISAPTLCPGPQGAFDEVAVKDPSIVFYDGNWHLFYTARNREEYTTGYVTAGSLADLPAAKRHELKTIRGKSRYGCAPQVFFFEPQKKWYLIFQNQDSNYQPAFSTTSKIAEPKTWSTPQALISKDTNAKWIDFWVICDSARAFLFYTQGHDAVMVRSTRLESFPTGWSASRKVLDNVHEAVHVYKVKGRREYHMIYELNRDGRRSFGQAVAAHLEGPWTKVTDRYAIGEQLRVVGHVHRWTDMVSHGEVLRCGFNQQLEYEPSGCRWLIQGITKRESNAPYATLPWKLGILTRVESNCE
jgi:hypothetical protein